MPKTPPATENQAAWVDVSQGRDAPNKAVGADNAVVPAAALGEAVERATEPPAWWLYLRVVLCALALIWITQWITTRRIIAERPPLRIETGTPPLDTTPKTLLSTTEKSAPNTTQNATKIVVHIIGAVKQPGVYEVGSRARLRDAVHLAGGPLAAADLEAVNLAEFLADGQQYAIPNRNAKTAAPTVAEIPSAQTSRSARVENDNAPKVSVKAAPRAPKNVPPSSPLDLNRATAIELDTLPDIGPAKAARIIEYRSQNGAFKSVEDLVEVEGIGAKTLEKLRPYVVVR